MPSDTQLLSRISDRDRGAFHRLFERHSDRVYRFALALTRSPHLAEEVLQETMMAVWKGAKNYKGRSKVMTWILGITRNQAHNILRKESKGQRLPAADTAAESLDPTHSLHVDLCVQQALATLPPMHREVMHLVFYENLTMRETAELLDIPEGTVKSRMYHARNALAKELT